MSTVDHAEEPKAKRVTTQSLCCTPNPQPSAG